MESLRVSWKCSATQLHCILPVVSDPWCSQETQQEVGGGSLQYHLLLSAKLARAFVADKRKLSQKVVLGIVPVRDAVFLARPFNLSKLWGKHPLCWRESSSKCVKAIRGLVIVNVSSLKRLAYMPRVSKNKYTWQFLHLREKWGFPKGFDCG